MWCESNVLHFPRVDQLWCCQLACSEKYGNRLQLHLVNITSHPIFLLNKHFRHESLENANTNRWLNEMDGQRRILAKFGGAPEEEIVGIRSPQLALGGDNQFEVSFKILNTISKQWFSDDDWSRILMGQLNVSQSWHSWGAVLATDHGLPSGLGL